MTKIYKTDQRLKDAVGNVYAYSVATIDPFRRNLQRTRNRTQSNKTAIIRKMMDTAEATPIIISRQDAQKHASATDAFICIIL